MVRGQDEITQAKRWNNKKNAKRNNKKTKWRQAKNEKKTSCATPNDENEQEKTKKRHAR